MIVFVFQKRSLSYFYCRCVDKYF